jgi:ribosomal protein L39E
MIRLIVDQSKVPMYDRQNAGRKVGRMEHQIKEMPLLLLHETTKSMARTNPQPSQKTFKIKQKLAKKARQNRPIPQWFRLKTDSESIFFWLI